MPRQRDLAKAAIRLHSSAAVPDWDGAAEQVGLTPEQLGRWRRRPDWPELCREVGEEDLACALPIAVSRLVGTSRNDKTASGVTAARSLIDICLGRYTPADIGETEPIDFGTLTDQEREVACRLVAMFTRRAVA